MLFAAARAQLVEDVIAPALARGATVVADRYIGSSLVYQGVVRGLGSRGRARRSTTSPPAGCVPDATVLHRGHRRAGGRRGSDPRVADRFEREPIEFHRKVIAAYEDVLASRNGRSCASTARATRKSSQRACARRWGCEHETTAIRSTG